MYRGSRPFHPIGESSSASCVIQLQILPPYWEGSGATTACPVVSCGSRASGIKKSLADLPMQLGLHVPNARVHVSKAPNDRAIIGLQDVRAGSTFNACKTCRHAAAVQYSTMRLDRAVS
jgi:hypothetical protein